MAEFPSANRRSWIALAPTPEDPPRIRTDEIRGGVARRLRFTSSCWEELKVRDFLRKFCWYSDPEAGEARSHSSRSVVGGVRCGRGVDRPRVMAAAAAR